MSSVHSVYVIVVFVALGDSVLCQQRNVHCYSPACGVVAALELVDGVESVEPYCSRYVELLAEVFFLRDAGVLVDG